MWPQKKLQLFPLDVGFPPFASLIIIPVGIRCLFSPCAFEASNIDDFFARTVSVALHRRP
jgi:hypothetical protein